MKLSPDQKQAINHINTPLCILGNAGTGKTVVIAHKIADLINNKVTTPEKILVFCPSNHAKNHLESLTKTLIKKTRNSPKFTTPYSFCADILRKDGALINVKENFTIYPPSEQQRIILSVCSDHNKKQKENIYNILQYIRKLKNSSDFYCYSKNANKIFKDEDKELVLVCKKYQKKLHAYNSLDKDDLISLCLKLFQKEPQILEKYQNYFSHIVIDEYENCSATQDQLFHLLAAKHQNIYVAGDPLQGTGYHKGNSTKYLISFKESFPNTTVINLDKNFRSTSILQKEAAFLFKERSNLIKEKLAIDSKKEQALTYYLAFNEIDEANYIGEEIEFLKNQEQLSYEDILVLVRTPNQRQILEKIFQKKHIPYKLSYIENILIKSEIQFIIYYLRMVLNPQDNEALHKIALYSFNKVSSTSLVKLKHLSEKADLSLFTIYSKNPELIPKSCRKEIRNLFSLVSKLKKQYSKSKNSNTLVKVVQLLISLTGLIQRLEKENTLESLEREENINEFCQYIIKNNFSLTNLLDYIALTTKLNDNVQTAPKNSLSLITLSQAKGLEAKAVFIAGLEEGLIPHYESLFDPEKIEEEKRLLYIGLLRAKKFIYLTAANMRSLFGDTWQDELSRFLKALPKASLAGFVSDKLITNKEAINSKILPICPHYQIRHSDEELTPTKKTEKFCEGQKIYHKELGPGIIKKITGKDNKMILEIIFQQSIKQLMAKYAKIDII